MTGKVISSINKIFVILGLLFLFYVLPALAQKLPDDRIDAILMNMNEKVTEIKTKVESIDDTVTKLDKATTGEIASIKTNQDWLVWSVRGIAGGLLALAVYVFREKLFGKNSNGNGREFSPPKR